MKNTTRTSYIRITNSIIYTVKDRKEDEKKETIKQLHMGLIVKQKDRQKGKMQELYVRLTLS